MWKYWVITLQTDTEQQLVTESEGSAQVRELVAVRRIFKHKSLSSCPVLRCLQGLYQMAPILETEVGGSKWNSSLAKGKVAEYLNVF